MNLLLEDNSDAQRRFWEFADHFIEHYKELSRQLSTGKKQGINKTFHFTIEQWPKERAKTFFLGEHVGCCLSPSSAQFPAMVQRRMDDAMLFHVASDRDSGKPVALIWLYLAEKDEKVCLVANFFEVNTKYALEPELRLGLLNGLLKFTEQYCHDNPAIDGFYMNELTYGWNKGDLDDYPLVDCRIQDKLGGPLVLENKYSWSYQRPSTAQAYYLSSLQSSQFRLFISEILTNNISDGLCFDFSVSNSSKTDEEDVAVCTATSMG